MTLDKFITGVQEACAFNSAPVKTTPAVTYDHANTPGF